LATLLTGAAADAGGAQEFPTLHAFHSQERFFVCRDSTRRNQPAMRGANAQRKSPTEAGLFRPSEPAFWG